MFIVQMKWQSIYNVCKGRLGAILLPETELITS